MNLQGYHGTCSFAKESIAQHGLDPVRTQYRPDHWLGQGVYFFLSQKQAYWWASSVSSHNRGSTPLIYKVQITAPDEKVLNLDDNEQVALFFSRVVDVYLQAPSEEERPIFTDETLRAVFFDYYKEKYGISVIIETFQKDCVRYAGDLQYGERLAVQKDLTKRLGVYFKETQVCVSDKSCIKEMMIVYDGEDEVI